MIENRRPHRPDTKFWRFGSAFLQGAIFPVIIILVWHLVSDPQIRELPWLLASGISEHLPQPQALPPPLAVFQRWIVYACPDQPFEPAKMNYLQWLISGELVKDTVASLSRVLVGFAIGFCLATPLGLLMGANKRIYEFFDPTIQLLRPIPPIAFIPLSMLWFGLGDPPAYFLISLGAFFPILVNTMSGVRNVDSIFIRAARNLGASGFQLFWRVILPAATPHILTGVRVGLGIAFICVIVAEMIAVNSGLGYRILEAREYTDTAMVMAGMLTIGCLGLGLDFVINRINNHLLRWRRSLEHAGM